MPSMGRRKVEGNDIFGSLVNSGLFVFGTVDSVRQQLIEQWKVLPGEHIALVNHYAQMPKDAVIETWIFSSTRSSRRWTR